MAIFGLLNKIYLEEKVPKSMKMTVLTKIFFKKREVLVILQNTGLSTIDPGHLN